MENIFEMYCTLDVGDGMVGDVLLCEVFRQEQLDGCLRHLLVGLKSAFVLFPNNEKFRKKAESSQILSSISNQYRKKVMFDKVFSSADGEIVPFCIFSRFFFFIGNNKFSIIFVKLMFVCYHNIRNHFG